MKKKRSLLIVDDDLELLSAFKDALDPAYIGVDEILFSEDGASAIRVASSHRPDIILLDLGMKPVSGFDVLDEIAKRSIETRVVIFTGASEYRNIEIAVKCLKHGACDFICKPLKLKEIEDTLKKSLALDTTINMAILRSAPSVKRLMADVEFLNNQLQKTSDELKILQKRTFRKEIFSKFALVLTAVAAILVFKETNVIVSSSSLTISFVILVALLLIPWGNLKSLETQYKNLKTKLTIQNRHVPKD